MSKHKWKPQAFGSLGNLSKANLSDVDRPPTSESVPITVLQYGTPYEAQYQAATTLDRYRVTHKSFSNRMQAGELIPWEAEMGAYINQFQREHGATLHTARPTSVYSNYLFIWEMPCP